MSSFNRVILMGNLTRDPELKHTAGGTSLAKFGIATNETYTSQGEKKQRTTFVDVVAWGRTGEVINQYLKKGSPIFLEGRLEFSSWKDNATGQNRSKLEVVVDKFQFLGGTKSEGDARPAPAGGDKDYGEIPF